MVEYKVGLREDRNVETNLNYKVSKMIKHKIEK